MDDQIRKAAARILERMREIPEAEMMETGSYLSDTPVVPERKLNICGGHKACAIGSLWLAGGIRPRPTSLEDGLFHLPGVHEGDRIHWLRDRPPLQLALRTLNDVAQARIDAIEEEMELRLAVGFSDAIECYFESYLEAVWDPEDDGEFDHFVNVNMIEVIDEAREQLA